MLGDRILGGPGSEKLQVISLIYAQVCKSSMFIQLIEGQLGRGNCITFIGIDKDLNVYDCLMIMFINSHLNELEGNVKTYWRRIQIKTDICDVTLSCED